MRVLVFGAGVIGRIFAVRLARAGHDVMLLARGAAVGELGDGVTIHKRGDSACTARVRIVTDVSDLDAVDVAFLAVRRDQLEAATDDFTRIRSRVVVSLTDVPVRLDALRRLIGTERFVAAFPGVAGSLSDRGVVDFIDVRQQPTTVENSPQSREVVGMLTAAGFRVVTVPDMVSWLQTHVIFITSFETAIVTADGDVMSLARDYSAVREIVLDVRRGLLALESRGGTVSPPAIKTIFIRMPIWFATRYWMRQLAGPVGRVAFLPHAMKSADTELPALVRDVHSLTGL